MLQHHNLSSKTPERVVVVGAGGFIAGELCKLLIKNNIDRLELGRPGLDLLAPGSSEKLAAYLKPTDTVVFASARAPCINLEMLNENYRMMFSFCEAIRHQAISHLVYLSSDAVYKDSSEPITEASCAEPNSLHGIMHLTREVCLKSVFNGPIAIVRPTLVYGIGDPHNGYGPNRFARQAFNKENLPIFGNGEELRDHVAVIDVAELMLRIIMHRSSGVINAVSGHVVSFRQLAEQAAQAFDAKVSIVNLPRSGPMPHNGYRAFDNAAVCNSFPGFEFHSWREGLALMHASMTNGENL